MSSLPDDTKMDIRLYLGWPSRYRDSDSALEQALGYVDTDDVLQAAITGSILPSLQDIDSRLEGALCRLQFSAAAEVTTNAMEIVWLRAEGRRHVNRLSSLMAVPVREDVYAGAQRGDGYLRRG